MVRSADFPGPDHPPSPVGPWFVFLALSPRRDVATETPGAASRRHAALRECPVGVYGRRECPVGVVRTDASARSAGYSRTHSGFICDVSARGWAGWVS